MVFVLVLYLFCLVLLAIYGLHNLYLVLLYFHHRRDAVTAPGAPTEWPSVTLQLPIYNERSTVERLLRAVGQLDYPRDRLQVQVLDDSTDDTPVLVARMVDLLSQQGLDIVHVVRADRAGYKAGALQHGLSLARGEYVGILDADFVPRADYVKAIMPYFADPRVGCVQARWEHLNRRYSALTRSESLAADGHFMVEQLARTRSGLFANFNGTAGFWRTKCIADAGGWAGDTLTEDVDLSYRAQLLGWRIVFVPEIVVPAESSGKEAPGP
jgi:cellulose synthase/poly-beta-1,6-N-acetylglucosamine synthase-like glycosyltransferase